MQNFQKPIVLVGMMGSGKSVLAAECAKSCGLPTYDSDKEVENHTGRSIKEIFEADGEQHFREIEQEALCALLDQEPCFIATGGGAVLSTQTRAAIKDKAISVWLDVAVDELYERLKHQTDRPLLQTGNPKQVLQKLMDERERYYAQADIHLKISNETLSETAQRLLKDIARHVAAEETI